MKKAIITKLYQKDFYIRNELNTFEEIIKYFSKEFEEAKNHFPKYEEILVEFNSYDYGYDSGFEMIFHGRRTETDEEFAGREEKALKQKKSYEKQKKSAEKREKTLYENLKKKYEK